MGKQIEARKTERVEEDTITDDEIAAAKAAGGVAVKSETDKDTELDDLLNDIDDLLEEDAEDFVKAFRQRGGQ